MWFRPWQYPIEGDLGKGKMREETEREGDLHLREGEGRKEKRIEKMKGERREEKRSWDK